jgi:DNA-binding protein Fis
MKRTNEQMWNNQPFLERVIFLMNQCKANQEKAEELAKLNFNDLRLVYKQAINIWWNANVHSW